MKRLVRTSLRIAAATLFVCGAVAVCDQILAPAQPIEKSAANDILAGHAFYYAGKSQNAMAAYRDAIARDPKRLSAWLNGAVVLAELGRHAEAAAWYRHALALQPDSSRIATALAETELHRGRLLEAANAVDHALDRDPNAPRAWIAKGDVLLASSRASDAAAAFAKAAELRPSLTLAHYNRGRALELAGKPAEASAAFAKAAARDSYFTSARFELAEALVNQRRYGEARKQLRKLESAAPLNSGIRKLSRALRRRMKRDRGKRASKPAPDRRERRSRSRVRVDNSGKRVPRLRVGIGTTGMGKPLAWKAIRFSGAAPVEILNKKGGKRVARLQAGKSWMLRVHRNKRSRRRYIEILDEKGFAVARTANPVVLRLPSSCAPADATPPGSGSANRAGDED
jgi:tetratricopeptide (TPR) repeat protein